MKKAKAILKLTIFFGLAIILGTAGASDLGRLTLLESISQVLFGIILIFAGSAGLRLIKEAKRKRVNFKKRRVYEANTINAA